LLVQDGLPSIINLIDKVWPG